MSWYIILKGSVNVVVHGKVRRIKTASLADLTSFFLFLNLQSNWKAMGVQKTS